MPNKIFNNKIEPQNRKGREKNIESKEKRE